MGATQAVPPPMEGRPGDDLSDDRKTLNPFSPRTSPAPSPSGSPQLEGHLNILDLKKYSEECLLDFNPVNRTKALHRLLRLLEHSELKDINDTQIIDAVSLSLALNSLSVDHTTLSLALNGIRRITDLEQFRISFLKVEGLKSIFSLLERSATPYHVLEFCFNILKIFCFKQDEGLVSIFTPRTVEIILLAGARIATPLYLDALLILSTFPIELLATQDEIWNSGLHTILIRDNLDVRITEMISSMALLRENGLREIIWNIKLVKKS